MSFNLKNILNKKNTENSLTEWPEMNNVDPNAGSHKAVHGALIQAAKETKDPKIKAKMLADAEIHRKLSMKSEGIDENIEMAKHASAIANAASDAIPEEGEEENLREMHNSAAGNHLSAANYHNQQTAALLKQHLEIASHPKADEDHINNSRDRIMDSMKESEEHAKAAASHMRMAQHH